MILPRIQDAQIEACTEFARSVAKSDEQTGLLVNALNITRLMTAANMGETLDTNVMVALGGQISFCNWFENIIREACNEREAKAKAEGSKQFLEGGVGER